MCTVHWQRLRELAGKGRRAGCGLGRTLVSSIYHRRWKAAGNAPNTSVFPDLLRKPFCKEQHVDDFGLPLNMPRNGTSISPPKQASHGDLPLLATTAAQLCPIVQKQPIRQLPRFVPCGLYIVLRKVFSSLFTEMQQPSSWGPLRHP